MIAYKDIRQVHLELSTLCNAACPLCPRNFYGYPHNNGYPEVNLTLPQAETIFTPEFLLQLRHIVINGNFGDIVMNPETPDIVEYFKRVNPKIEITISTNGSARNAEFWRRLAATGAKVQFCLDGLEDTHSRYRRNTVWSTVINNAKTFINSGGYAIWKFIAFNHNQHQIVACQDLSKQLGFKFFEYIDHKRNSGPVYNNQGELIDILGKYDQPTEFETKFSIRTSATIELRDITQKESSRVVCDTVKRAMIYIAANGDVSPCCWTGFYPATYGNGTVKQVENAQLTPLIYKNNALEYPISECIEWFNKIKESWAIKNYSDGRLLVCDSVCGR